MLKKAQEDARNFYRLGLDVEKVAQGVGYTVETVKEWLDCPIRSRDKRGCHLRGQQPQNDIGI